MITVTYLFLLNFIFFSTRDRHFAVKLIFIYMIDFPAFI